MDLGSRIFRQKQKGTKTKFDAFSHDFKLSNFFYKKIKNYENAPNQHCKRYLVKYLKNTKNFSQKNHCIKIKDYL